ncbi:cytochrome P450 family protein [Streptacidiphilus fuscans]|uniref:Cytochrome P450 n=1 Tax=Streptacidiphilus fuscans TaxID=2789292 RepID=A0A931B161_9ACTN|nr:cytochrome P450 [Streptacidiphilus fuscans]MBF9069194.1 cytochrome P450 [Streptacidiphilus fuscans]
MDPIRDPYPVLARMRSACPVHPLTDRSGRTGGYLVLGYDEARQALADPRLSKNTAAFFADKAGGRNIHPALSQTMLATDPPDHTRLRRLATSAFTSGAVGRLRPAIARITDELLDQWPAEGEVDAVASLAVPLPVTVICDLLGVPEEDRDQLRAWSIDFFAAGAPERTDRASHALARYLEQLTAAKRSSPGDSLLDALIAARDEGARDGSDRAGGDRAGNDRTGGDRLSEAELVSLAALLVVAGHETTTAFLGNALLALLDHPAQLDLLRSEPERLPKALDELLRYDPPVAQATFRFATEQVELGDTVIPPGSPVLVSPAAANRDPSRFADPDRLDLTREAGGHLAFGHGIHRCLGAQLARAEAEIALSQLLARFPALRLAVPRDQLTWQPTRLVRTLTALPLSVASA